MRFLNESKLLWSYWALDGGKWSESAQEWKKETYGILDEDYKSVRSEQKLKDLQSIMNNN